MDTPIWVKAGTALGFSVLALFGLKEAANIVFVDDAGHGQHASVDTGHGTEATGTTDHGTGHDENGEAFDLASALAEAKVSDKSVKKCITCHTFEKGGDNKIGPNLWNILGQPKAHLENFAYSAPMAGAGGVWTYDELFAFVSDPKGSVPGTKMSFAGLKKPAQAAAAIAYMRTMSDSPMDLPAVSAAAADAVEEAAHGAEHVTEAVADVAEDAAEATEDTVHAAEDAAHAVEETAEEAVEDAAAAVEESVGEAAASAEDAASDMAGDTADAVEEAASTADEATEATTDAAEAVEEAAAATEETVAEVVEAAASMGDAAKGAKISKKCATCHTFDQGGANKVGPNLWGIVGKAKGANPDFKYSAALSGAGGTWTEADLDAYSANPRAFLPGTKMTFAGIKKDSQRADLIAYLKSLSE